MIITPKPGDASATVYEQVGGRPFFDRLVDRFYDEVEADPLVRPLYPDDLTAPRRHTAGFLAQYWGGGTGHYSDDRGHPRLRMRHAPFAIGGDEAIAWLRCMDTAVRAQELPPPLEAAMLDYFANAAAHMVNTA